MYVYIIMAVVVILAALIQSTSGFGFGIVFMAVMPLFFPYKTCTVLSVLTCFVLQVYTMIRLWRHIQWRYILLPAATSIVCSGLSVHVMLSLNETVMNIILGLFLWLLAAYMIWLSPRIHLKKNHWIEVGVGALSGGMAGLFAVGGPPIVAYYDAVMETPKTYQATIQTYFMLTSCNILITNFMYGNLTQAIVVPAIVSISSCLIGMFIGMRILTRISMQTIRRLAYIVMLVAGTYDIFKVILV